MGALRLRQGRRNVTLRAMGIARPLLLARERSAFARLLFATAAAAPSPAPAAPFALLALLARLL